MTHPIAEGRACGQCSLCCKVLRIDEIDKPAGRWCQHCQPGNGGCTIYETRPEMCQKYACGWLMSPAVGDEWFPMKSHMVLTYAPLNGIMTITVSVDGSHPLAWRQPPYHHQLRNMARAGMHVKSADDIRLVQVRCNGRVWLMTDKDDIEITNLSYIVKLLGSGQYGIELFETQEGARDRVAELTRS